jgi:hypothetical protein
MQEVQLHLWDDKHWHDAEEKVTSEETHFLELDGRRVKLDLTAAHSRELAELVGSWLDAGSDVDAPPVTRLGHKAGSKESKDWHAGLRAWADKEGRTEEYLKYRPSGKIDYRYPVKLVQDYEAYLLAQAQAA